MTLTVYDAMKLETLKNFRLVCGQLGLERVITRTAILDYEFSDHVSREFSDQFNSGEFVLSSMLYARQDEAALLGAVRKLIELDASALAVKTVFFKFLPESVCTLANEAHFPIFLFDNQIFFEDVIAEITEALRANDKLNQISKYLDALLDRDLTRIEIRKISTALNRDFKKELVVYYGKPKEHALTRRIEKIYDTFQKNKYRGNDILMTAYREGIMFFISDQLTDPKLFKHRLDESLIHCGLTNEPIHWGSSSVYDALDDLNLAVREAVWAQKASEAEASLYHPVFKSFRDIGIYRLLLPLSDSPWCEQYYQLFLAPMLLNDSEAGNELLKTAIAFVACQGNLKQTAEQLYVHENTVRYRISNLHKKLCPDSNELAFYEQLSAAVRLYVLKTQDHCM